MASTELHESADELGPDIIDVHRAIVSIMEELEAVDWYNQRAKVCNDAELRAVLEHNRDEEKEHAAMLLEWLRRKEHGLDRHLRTYLWSEGRITDVEAASEDHDHAPEMQDLGIGAQRARNGR